MKKMLLFLLMHAYYVIYCFVSLNIFLFEMDRIYQSVTLEHNKLVIPVYVSHHVRNISDNRFSTRLAGLLYSHNSLQLFLDMNVLNR